MEYQKITNLLGNIPDKVPRFITKKRIEVHDQSGKKCNTNKLIRFNTSILSDYSDAYIVVKGKITVTNPDNDAYDKKLTFKNNAPFTNCILKINNAFIDNAEDLNITICMYNLIKYSQTFRKTTGSLWNYYRDEPNSGAVGNINYSIKDSKSFNYKTSITGKLEGNNVEKDDVETVVPLKYLSNFWRKVNTLLISCEISLTLTWSENCVITSKATREADPDADPAASGINNPTNAVFKITDSKLYVTAVTLSAENDNKLLQQLKTGFKRAVKWNKYRSEMSNQTKNNNLNHLIDSTFTNVNRLFVLSFENEEDRTSFSKYYVPKVEIKNFNRFIYGKLLFKIPVKNKEEAYEQSIEMSKNNDYTTGNLLDYEYFKDHCKLTVIDLSKKIELENPDIKQQINFTGILEENNATMFFIIEKQNKKPLLISHKIL